MTAATARRLAWLMCGVGIAAIVAAAVVSARYPFTSAQETYDPIGEFFWAASWMGFGIVGALIVSRRRENRIGWILVAITFTLGVGILAPAYARAAYHNPSAGLPLLGVASWFGTWMSTLAFGFVVALLLLFPSGRLTTTRQRIVAIALCAVVAANIVLEALRAGPVEGDAPPMNPVGIIPDDLGGAIAGVVGSAFAIVGLATLLDFVYRFWRSRGAQRQQFRWMAYAAGAFPVLFLLAMTLEDAYTGPDSFDPVIPVFFLCGNGLAAAIGIAITRHGLYEINRVISRSVSYLVLTVLLAAIYLGAVTILTGLTAPVTGDSPLAVAAATLAAAAAFGPARRRIQSAVDRRFNRQRYDAARTVDGYRARLRDEVDLASLSTELVGTVGQTMQPMRIALWLHNPRHQP